MVHPYVEPGAGTVAPTGPVMATTVTYLPGFSPYVPQSPRLYTLSRLAQARAQKNSQKSWQKYSKQQKQELTGKEAVKKSNIRCHSAVGISLKNQLEFDFLWLPY